MKIAVFGKTFSPDYEKYIVDFFKILQSEGIEVVIFKPFYVFLRETMDYEPIINSYFNTSDDLAPDVKFLISIGGDGTFLESIRYLKSFDIPVIGLNSGRLGFLANISKEEITEAVKAIVSNNYQVELRSLLVIKPDIKTFKGDIYALNDATIQKNGSTMITIDAFLDNEFLNTYWTDGLIISTPTGSTAYNLSVGGPIVLPGSENIVIVPIASHNLTVRPLVIPDSTEIKLVIKSRSNNFLVTMDHRTEVIEGTQSTLTIRKADFKLKMVKFPFNNYYSTLRNKLMWGVDKRN